MTWAPLSIFVAIVLLLRCFPYRLTAARRASAAKLGLIMLQVN
jgi:hypothetical protein